MVTSRSDEAQSGVEPAMGEAGQTYDGFISYSHAADGLLAPRLQSALQRFAKPWWKRRAVRIFRDESSLSANPHLWSSITEALDTSGWFVLLLSPDAAASGWVNQEITYWVENRDPKKILPVVTDGEFRWVDGEIAGGAVPDALREVFAEEPRWVDLRFARDEEQLDLKHSQFNSAVADIASTIRGVPKDELASEEVRQHRRTVRTAWAAGVAVTVLTVGVVIAGLLAVSQRNLAEERARSEAIVEEARRAFELASFSQAALLDDAQVALMTAIESVRVSAENGYVLPVALDSLHWAIQANQLAYPADATTQVAVRRGPAGRTGVFALPPDDLVQLAQSGLSRAFSDSECREFFPDGACSDPTDPLPNGLVIQGGEGAYGVAEPGERSLAGTRVEFIGAWPFSDLGLQQELDAFLERTGITVQYRSPDGVDAELQRRLEAGFSLPDVTTWPQPSAVAQWASSQGLVDLGQYLDGAALQSDFGEYLLSLGSVGSGGEWPATDGTLYGLPVDLDLKGLVYYPKAAFDAAGYEVPETLDELIELSRLMVADGQSPWCFAFESGLATGWPGTDLIESLVLRLGGVEAYEDWTYHRIPFDAPPILQAGRFADRLIFESGFIRGDPGQISRSSFLEPLFVMLQTDAATGAQDPGCFLLHQADFLFTQVPTDTELGVDFDFFPLPPSDRGDVIPATGGGGYAGVMRDRPEVRAFVEFLASPQYGEFRANSRSGNFLSANARFDTTNYRGGDVDPDGLVREAVGITVRDAVAAGVFRFDASDLMVPAIGSITPERERGAFWQGMIDFTDGVKPIDQVLSDIEEAWVALEASGS